MTWTVPSVTEPVGGSNSIRDLAADPARLEETWALVRSYCARLLGSAEDAEDATQVAFERGLRSGPEAGDPRPWLITVARNVCIDMIRRRAHTAAGGLDAVMAETAGPGDFERDVVTRDLLRTAFASLTPSERRAVGAAWMADQRSEDAARSIGMGDSALRTLLSRARRKLVAHIEEAERSIAGLFPWLGDLRHRAARRLLAGMRRDATWQERLVSLAAPAAALALTVSSVAVIGSRAGSPRPGGMTASSGGAAAAGGGAAALAAAARASTPGRGPAGAGPAIPVSLPPVLASLHPGRQQDAHVTDLQASPQYASDHTLLAVASDSACRVPPCSELYISRDSGHTWSLQSPAETSGLQGTQLLLPPATWPNTFYAFGTAGLQVTTNAGVNFTTLVPRLPGYAGLMPPGGSSNVTVANVDLWNFATAPAPGLQATYPAGARAAGAALALPGGTLLQPVLVAGASEQVLRCAAGACLTGPTLPWSDGDVQLTEGPGASVLAVSNHGLALSRDGGASFQNLRLPPGTGPWEAVLVKAPGGGVRVVSTFVGGGVWEITYSDDAGLSWHVASGLPVSSALALLRTRPDGTAMVAVYQGGSHRYYCSAAAGAWSYC